MVVTNAGLNEIRDWLAGTGATAPTHIAVGDDDTVPTTSDTAMSNELCRVAIVGTSSTEKEVEFYIIIDSVEQNGESFKEVGLLNAATSGDLFVHATHAAISKTALIEVEYRITLRITQG